MKNCLPTLLIVAAITSYAQELPVINGIFSNARIESVIISIAEQSEYTFYYDPKDIDLLTFTGEFTQAPLNNALTKLLAGTPLNHFIYQSAVYITAEVKIIDQPEIAGALSKVKLEETQEVEKGLLFAREYLNQSSDQDDLENYVFEIGDRKEFVSGGKSTVAGYVRDQETGDPLTGAVIYTEKPMVAKSTDQHGFFSITLPNGKQTLIIQYSGMKTTRRNIVLFSNGQLNVEMDVDVIALQEVTVEADRDANLQDVQMGVNKINVAATKNMPVALGERDIIKVATTFAGVQSPGEGASGFNVRGGKSDQNLILLNDATIFNASHFFGFFSVFNSDAIQDMEVYKSGIPAKFGGRLSAVFDIKSKEANKEKFVGVGGVSPITSRLTLEVPVIKEKAGLMLAGRTTYSNWLLKKVSNADFRENRVSFSDMVIRYDHDLNDKNELMVNGYYSKDIFRLSSDTLFSFSNFSYENANTSVKWTHYFNDKLDGSVSAIYSAFGYNITYDESAPNAFLQDFGINEGTLKANLNYYLDDVNTFSSGIDLKRYQINPGTKTPHGSESIVKPIELDNESALESSVYFSDEYRISESLMLSGGLRYTLFTRFGPQTVFEYEENAPKNADTKIDSTVFAKGEISQTYHGPEVRLSARYTLDDVSSLKASYTRTRQYIHTMSNSSSLSPTDIWRLSGTYIRPQTADQYSVGYYRNFSRNTIETSFEIYYKDLEHLLDFKVGSEFLLNNDIETVALQGPGKSYGMELSVKKSGRLNGWANYSYARTFMKLEGQFPEEIINRGEYYPANYDMPHTINVVANYKLTRRVSLSYNFTYNTGKPVTYPVATYGFKGFQAVNYSDRNTYRIPDYIRMDFGISIEAGHKIKKLAHSYWSLSVYNLLGRDNPYSVFFDLVDGEVQGYTLVVFGSPIPTVSYNFRF